jgi:pyridoxine 5-phosphate synthase
VCHLREDRRHINDRDVRLLRETVKTKLDLEMAATEEIVRIAIETLPELVTLVPEKRQELTTEGGLDVVGHRNYLQDVIEEFHRHEIEVSLFVDPIAGQIEAAKAIGSDMIEIHTGEYANARTEKEALALLEIVHSAAKLGVELGMVVNAGHGLNYVNIGPITSIEEISEVSIGHAVISRSLFVGLERAVREMKDLMR